MPILSSRSHARAQRPAPLLVPLLLLALLAACDRQRSDPSQVDEVTRAVDEAIAVDAQGSPQDDSMAWVAQMGKPMLGDQDAAFAIRAAPVRDEEFSGSATVAVRRLVYRVRFVVPGVFRRRPRDLLPQAGELHVDVADRRLRARFLGPGWPVHDGSEVRLREDMPGLYAFDGFGGRWLSPGDMAAWFDGKMHGQPRSGVRVRREFGASDREDTGPGELLCALLAEWTNQSRDSLEGRCRGDSIPPGFRFGPWSAELTAIVPMRLPKHQLRADHVDPPHVLTGGHFGPMLSETEVDQLKPDRPLPPPEPSPENEDSEEFSPEGETAAPLQRLTVRNTADARVIMLARGVPLGWVDSGRSGTFSLPPGIYRMGAIRPLGLVRMGKTLIAVPGEVTVHPPRSLEPASDPEGLREANR